jgi:catechol 2,3-dioxygenase-like lactoylglutathione lyase family enzyme
LPAESPGSTRLSGVDIRSTDLDHDIGVFAAITGTTPTSLDERSAAFTDRAEFAIGDAHVTLSTSNEVAGSARRGIERLIIEVADLDAADNELRSVGAAAEREDNVVQISREWAGVHVELRTLTTEQERPTRPAGAVLDHVAILVADIELMATRWAAILGGPPAHAGVHPLGTSIAARFLLGDRMIELLAPPSETASPLQARLDRFGQGPFALAIIANDLETTITAVSDSGARLIDQPPHIVVHPSDASGVPVQLTPRVHHETPADGTVRMVFPGS